MESPAAVACSQCGAVEFPCEKAGILHSVFGKPLSTKEAIVQNIHGSWPMAVVPDQVPSGAKRATL